MTREKDMEYKHSLMDGDMKVNGRMAREKDMECRHSLIERDMMVSGIKT
jgi:hypothetical protein